MVSNKVSRLRIRIKLMARRIGKTTAGKSEKKGISRRGFIQLVGAGALATTVGDVGKPSPVASRRSGRKGGDGPGQPAGQRPKRHRLQDRTPLVLCWTSSARKLGLTGPEDGVRPRGMRRLHGPDRRPAALRLPDPGPGGGRKGDHHGRGAFEGR